MQKLESVYYLGICFERFFLANTFNANQTKQVNKQKCTKKIDGGRNKRKRNEGIHSESAASQQHVYHMFYCLSRYTFVHPLLRYLLLLHLLQLFGNFKCCFLDRITAKLLIGFTTDKWIWNEWGKHPNICLNVLIHCCFELPHFDDKKHFVTIRFMGENIQIMAIWWENKG